MLPQELMPKLEDLNLIADILETQDVMKQLGECEDYMDDDGYCRMCTALQSLHALINNMKEGCARIVVEE